MTQHLSIQESWRQAATLHVYTPIENFFRPGHRKQSRNFGFFIGIRHVSACQPWERKERGRDRGGRNWPAGLSIPRSWKPGTNDLNILTSPGTNQRLPQSGALHFLAFLRFKVFFLNQFTSTFTLTRFSQTRVRKAHPTLRFRRLVWPQPQERASVFCQTRYVRTHSSWEAEERCVNPRFPCPFAHLSFQILSSQNDSMMTQ